MSVLHINNDQFKKEVLDFDGTVLVDFYAEWCGPCKMTGPILDQLSNEKKDIKFVKVNVDENPGLASEYSVFSIPTFIVVKKGEVVHQFVGAMGKEGFEAELQKIHEQN